MNKLFLTSACCALSLLSLCKDADAIVISDSRSSQTISPSSSIARERSSSNNAMKRFRLRRTSNSDLDAICTMLAYESVGSNHFMHRLRAKSSFYEQLHHRLHAIDEGRRTLRSLQHDVVDSKEEEEEDDDECMIFDNSNNNHMRNLLSVNDEFKAIIQKAVSFASEPNAWEECNLDLTTTLHHVMVTIEEPISKSIVGFCEIGYVKAEGGRVSVSDSSLDVPTPLPDINNEEMILKKSCKNTRINYAPTILNLVVSPSYRRLGLASRLVNFAQKYTRAKLRRQDLGLYVHPENHSAVNLYTSKGFEVVTTCNEGLLYMSV